MKNERDSKTKKTNLSRRKLLLTGAASLGALALLRFGPFSMRAAHAAGSEHFEVAHTDAEWLALLTSAQYAVLRQQGTERAFTSPLDHEKRSGTFSCAGCDNALFSSKTKFDSGTGWPSFWQPLPKAVNETTDSTLGMERTEVHCRRCGGHLGHVFNDGPRPSGLRYCMNGVAMKFQAEA